MLFGRDVPYRRFHYLIAPFNDLRKQSCYLGCEYSNYFFFVCCFICFFSRSFGICFSSCCCLGGPRPKLGRGWYCDFGTGLTCLCTGQWEFVLGCWFYLHVLANGSSRFGAFLGADLTCLCTGQWELAVRCGFDLFVYWPMGARGWVRVESRREESRVASSRVESSRVESSRVESRRGEERRERERESGRGRGEADVPPSRVSESARGRW